MLRHPAPRAIVLLWHGRGPNEAHVLHRLAAALSADGHAAVTPNWDASTADGGAAALRASLAQAAAIAAKHSLPLVLVGWSLGGTAALSLALDPSRSHEVTAVVGLAADVREQSPLDGTRPLVGVRRGLGTPSLHLVHGVQDTVVPSGDAEEFARSCLAAGIPCALSLVDTDHAGVVGAEYDPAAGICRPSDGPAATRGVTSAIEAVREATAG